MIRSIPYGNANPHEALPMVGPGDVVSLSAEDLVIEFRM